MKKIMLIIFIALFFGCSSLPKKITREEYNSVRDYVSGRISGMSYLELSERLSRQTPPQYHPDGGFLDFPYSEEQPGGHDFSEYNKYMMEISNKMNQLTSGYKQTDHIESFYTWAIRNYDM